VAQTYGWVETVRTREWSYSEIWKPEAHQERFHVSPGAPPSIYKPQLYNLEKDPNDLTDVADRYPDIARQMSARMKDYIAAGEEMIFGSFNTFAACTVGLCCMRANALTARRYESE